MIQPTDIWWGPCPFCFYKTAQPKIVSLVMHVCPTRHQELPLARGKPVGAPSPTSVPART